MSDFDPAKIVWTSPDGERVSCTEKIKVLNENLEELREIATEAFEDAVLIGCDPRQVRRMLIKLMESIEDPYSQ